jgi:homoserine kinase
VQRLRDGVSAPRRTREIVVPASIGNLGPGFDTLGLAVSLYLRARVTRRIEDGQGRLVCTFMDGAPSGKNRIQQAFDALPARNGRASSLEVEIRSDIPQQAGLGSSAAATIAGLRLRELADGRRPVDQILAAAYRLERHPDNAAAALFGGLTTSSVSADGRVTVGQWQWPATWRLIVATPETQLSTSESRRALPDSVPFNDVIFNLQRLGQLLSAVQSRSAAGLSDAFGDRCHQPYRERLVPALRRALVLQHPDMMGVCLSGAGPSVVAFARRNLASVERALSGIYKKEGVPCIVRTLRVHPSSAAGSGGTSGTRGSA